MNNSTPDNTRDEDDFLPSEKHFEYMKTGGEVKFLLGQDGKVSVTDGWGTDLETDVDVTLPVSEIGEVTRENLLQALAAVQAGVDGKPVPKGAERLYAAGQKLAQDKQAA